MSADDSMIIARARVAEEAERRTGALDLNELGLADAAFLPGHGRHPRRADQRVQPGTFDDFLNYGFDDPKP